MPRHIRDLTKEGPFHRLTAILCLGRRNNKGNAYFLCRCECGNTIEAKGSHLVSGNIKSCGCMQRESGIRYGKRYGGHNKTHGMSGTTIHQTWASMMDRCHNPKNGNYHLYGGRGITVCDRWHAFENFHADMGDRPKGKSIDRIDNNLGYFPGNCRWSTQMEQTNNTRRNVLLTFQGRTMTLSQWARFLGISHAALDGRWRSGWTVERILTQPIQIQKGKRGQISEPSPI